MNLNTLRMSDSEFAHMNTKDTHKDIDEHMRSPSNMNHATSVYLIGWSGQEVITLPAFSELVLNSH